LPEFSERRKTLLLCLALVAGVFAVYGRALHFSFINYDDPIYVYRNEMVKKGLSPEGLRWAFANGISGNWHPLTWLSHMLDWQLFGNAPGMHHAMSVFFHCVNSILVFVVFKRMTGALWRGFFVAALFAFHPLHVESVAWVAERKDVLCAFFFLLALLSYHAYAARGGALRYSATLALFACGLMAKPMLVTFPFVLLLLDYWPLKRFGLEPRFFATRRFGRLLLEKAPMLALSAVVCVVTYHFQSASGAVNKAAGVNHPADAAVAYVLYLVKMVAPLKLGVMYPLPSEVPFLKAASSALVLMAITVAVCLSSGRRGYLLTGWFWYVGTLVPVIGLIQVGSQAMADRYTYIPLCGIFIMIVWGAHEISAENRFARMFTIAFGCACCVALPFLARRQAGYWRNSMAVFSRAVAVTKDNCSMLENLCSEYAEAGNNTEAESCFRQAIQRYPDFYSPNYNLGVLLFKQNKFGEAVHFLGRAVRLDSASALSHGYYGRAMQKNGDLAGAVREMRTAARIDTSWTDPANTLAWILATCAVDSIRNPAEALILATRACVQTSDSDPAILDTKACAFAGTGDFKKAVEVEDKALGLLWEKDEDELSNDIAHRRWLFQDKKPFIDK
jgi:Flp pilus assembly protein TadD